MAHVGTALKLLAADQSARSRRPGWANDKMAGRHPGVLSGLSRGPGILGDFHPFFFFGIRGAGTAPCGPVGRAILWYFPKFFIPRPRPV